MSWCVLEFVEIQRFTKGESRMATLGDVTPGPCAEEIIGEPGYDRLRRTKSGMPAGHSDH